LSDIHGDAIAFVEPRIAVHWGDFSQVEAMLALLRQARAAGDFDRYVLLSGADYPLRSASAIEQFFGAEPANEYINLVAMPSTAAGKPLSRLATYRLRPGDPFVARIARKVLMLARIVPSERDYKAHLKLLAPYAGSTWWALSGAACEHIVAFAARETAVVEFFKNTVCPDESFFHTILGNSPFLPRIVRNLTYTDWSAGGASPAGITQQHLAVFDRAPMFPPDDTYGAGAMLFARKFSDHSAQLVALMDLHTAHADQAAEAGSVLKPA
jgi:hypothetical protein